MQDDISRIPALVGQIYATARALHRLYPGLPFTPDGHLLGCIGLAVAADTYGLALAPFMNPAFDAESEGGHTVEITLTQGRSIVLPGEDQPTPDLLIAFRLDSVTGFEEVYNGPFPLDLWRAKKTNKNGKRTIALSQLRAANPRLLPQRHPLAELNRHFGAGA